MNPIVIWRTANGYIVTNDDGYMTQQDIVACHVFNTLGEVAKFIAPPTKPERKSDDRKQKKSIRKNL